MVETLDGNSRHPLRLANLDGLRGVAIVMVVLFHTYSRWGHVTPWSETSFEEDFFSYGWLGVNLFFIISGFVIFWSLEKSNSFTSFGIRRWLRLFPAMLLASGLIYATAHLIPQRPSGLPDFKDIWPGLLFIQPGFLDYFFNADIKPLDGAFWSLFVEVKFYFIAAVAFFYLRDKKGIVVTALFGLYVLSSLLYMYFNISGFSSFYDLCVILDFNYFGWFACGIFFYKYWSGGGKIYSALSLVCALASTATEMVNRNDFYILLFGILIYLIFVASFYENFMTKLFVSKIMLFFGFISYPLYLIHQNMIIGLGIEFHYFFSQMDYAWFSVMPIVLVIGASFAIAHLEPYIKLFLRGFFNWALVRLNPRAA